MCKTKWNGNKLIIEGFPVDDKFLAEFWSQFRKEMRRKKADNGWEVDIAATFALMSDDSIEVSFWFNGAHREKLSQEQNIPITESEYNAKCRDALNDIVQVYSVRLAEVNQMLDEGKSFTEIMAQYYPEWAERHKEEIAKEARSAAEEAAIQARRALRKSAAKERKKAGAARKANMKKGSNAPSNS